MARSPIKSLRDRAPWLLVGLLAACGAPSTTPPGTGRVAGHYPGLECAPFARELSGVALYGDAASWWDDADGRYDRAPVPAIGAVLVFRRQDRLPAGHVSVVSRVLGPRQILVLEANWMPAELDEDQLVVDVSGANDWTEVRVWYPPLAQLGAHTYETYGFILPRFGVTHDELAAASRRAAVIAVGARVGRPLPRARSYGG